MQLGLLEIGIIIVVALVIYGLVRMMRLGQNVAKKNETPVGAAKQEDDKKPERVRHPRLQITGIALTLIGIIILLASVSLVKWFFWGSVWALIVIAVGLLIIFMIRRR